MSRIERPPHLTGFRLPGGSELHRGGKYLTGPVLDRQAGQVFLKAVIDPSRSKIREDLAHEFYWAREVGLAILAYPASSFKIPKVVEVDSGIRWVAYEWMDGHELGEDQLEAAIPHLAHVAYDLQALPINWPGVDLSSRFRRRFEKATDVLNSDYIGSERAAAIKDVVDGDLSALMPGLVHGDFVPKNMIVAGDDLSIITLVDFENGARPGRSEWYKPRREDIAYLYHILCVQYRRPDLATQLLDEVTSKLSQNPEFDPTRFTREFALSLLERTVSMMQTFIFGTPETKEIDPRRLDPDIYVEVIDQALEMLIKK